MQFSDSSGKTGIIQYAEVLTGLGDGQISGNGTLLKQFTTLINNWYNYVTTLIVQAQDDWEFDDLNNTDYPIGTTSLVANQQDYPLPSANTVLKVRRVEVSYDGTNWYKAEPFSRYERGKATDTASIANDFNTTEPFYSIESGSIFLWPIPTQASASGLKIFYIRQVSIFVSTDTTKAPGFDVIFHPILAQGASYEWSLSKDLKRAEAIKEMLFGSPRDKGGMQKIVGSVEMLQQHYSTKNRERNVIAMKAADPGYE